MVSPAPSGSSSPEKLLKCVVIERDVARMADQEQKERRAILVMGMQTKGYMLRARLMYIVGKIYRGMLVSFTA
jgi:hypothetical protein